MKIPDERRARTGPVSTRAMQECPKKVSPPLQSPILLRQVLEPSAVSSETFLRLSLGRGSRGALPVHPAALRFNQYHIKFNAGFETRTRFKASPQGGPAE